ncbi:MAG: post-transcriptional regulator [Thomasclavelia sp.]|nr:post-transcriptional regulator [Thomasclavelia sp.]
MMNERESVFDKNDLNRLIDLKRHEFKVKEGHNITNESIKKFLFTIKWKKKTTLPLCDLVDDIMSLEFSEVFDYLSVEVIKEANTMNINAFNDLISK